MKKSTLARLMATALVVLSLALCGGCGSDGSSSTTSGAISGSTG